MFSSRIDVNKLETYIEINNLINSNYTDVKSLLTHILESATRLTEGEASSLLLLDKASGRLYFEIALGSKGTDVKKFTVKMGEGIAGWAALHNRTLLVNDVANDPRFNPEISKQVGYPTKCIVAVPMRIKDECVGIIELINKKDGKLFSEDDVEWLENFATQAAIAIQNAQFYQKAQEEIHFLQDQIQVDKGYHTLIAKSRIILEKLEILDRVAKTDSSVLILGESGVGKELFAEQIHLRSLRNGKPFVRVNCAAIPEGLLESELFGHVKGAFTDAVQDRRGRFEMADKGTIFLDEIGDLPLKLQSKLLRVIQQRSFEKVGSNELVSVDVRILAATNKDIELLVTRGEFRNDLYYRLNVLPIYVPPLRQRNEDIPELADFFLKKFCRETKKHFLGFSDDAMEAMLSYQWPGNIRELENAVERAVVICKGEYIHARDLLLNLTGEHGDEYHNKDLKTALNIFKRHFITKALELNRWNQTGTAKSLKIQRTYLSRLIKELEITIVKE
jgi:Nif-specific regulatory protein